MTLKELQGKFASKDIRMYETVDKIKAVELEIASLDRQKEASISGADSGKAVEIVKELRRKGDELSILCSVRDGIKNTPAVTQGDIQSLWGEVCTEVLSEYDGDALPELREAYSRYCQAVDKVAALRQKAHSVAYQLDGMAKVEGVYIVLENPFKSTEPEKLYPNRTFLAKLNSLNGLAADIRRPAHFGACDASPANGGRLGA